MSKSNPFKWRHYQAQIILRCVRWYCNYPLSYRQVAEMVNERAINELKAKKELPKKVKLRQKKYLNNIVEQDHRGIKRLVKPGMGFGSFNTARRTIKGYEAMSMIRKGQIKGVEKGAAKERVLFINQIFGVVA